MSSFDFKDSAYHEYIAGKVCGFRSKVRVASTVPVNVDWRVIERAYWAQGKRNPTANASQANIAITCKGRKRYSRAAHTRKYEKKGAYMPCFEAAIKPNPAT